MQSAVPNLAEKAGGKEEGLRVEQGAGKNTTKAAKKPGKARLLGPLQCHPENPLLAGLLDEGYDPQICWIGPGVELDVNVLRETLSQFEAADFRESLHHAHVGQTPPAILAAQYLRFSMIQRRNQIDISLTNLRGFG
jgi:hypothetical protein